MKSAALILGFLAAGIFNSKAQPVVSSCSANDSVVKAYHDDADRLALRYILKNHLPGSKSVEIPKTESDKILRALIAVYNAKSLTARDTVVKLFDIHAWPDPVMNSIVIETDTGLTWMNKLRNNVFPTGYKPIDSMIKFYGLQTGSFISLPWGHDWVSFNSTRNYNPYALIKEFLTIPDVTYGEPNGMMGDGNDITDSIYSNHIELTYSYGWGDCPAGCGARRYWKFSVDSNCTVQFISSYGQPLPALGIEEKTFQPLKIFPQPFTSEINIADVGIPYSVEIYDVMGREVFSSEKLFTTKVSGLNVLPAGQYIVKLRSEGQVYSRLITKAEK